MVRKTILLIPIVLGGTVIMAQNRQDGPGPAVPPPAKNEVSRPVINNNTIDGVGAAVDPRTYVIGAEDVLAIKVWREPDFSSNYGVRPDGKITIPLVGDLQAAGLTPQRLSEQLEEALSEYINKPDVTVTIQQVNSKKFYLTGEVYRPGEYPLVTPTRIFDALSNAGGFRDFANKKKIILIRGNERYRFNYQDVLKGRNLGQNIFLQNGDTLVVP
jgi:polysaccharide export outer membrane protein